MRWIKLQSKNRHQYKKVKKWVNLKTYLFVIVNILVKLIEIINQKNKSDGALQMTHAWLLVKKHRQYLILIVVKPKKL